MQTQQPLSQEQEAAVIVEMEQYQYLCAWAEVAGSAVADSYSQSAVEAEAVQAGEPEAGLESIWGQVMVWQGK